MQKVKCLPPLANKKKGLYLPRKNYVCRDSYGEKRNTEMLRFPSDKYWPRNPNANNNFCGHQSYLWWLQGSLISAWRLNIDFFGNTIFYQQICFTKILFWQNTFSYLHIKIKFPRPPFHRPPCQRSRLDPPLASYVINKGGPREEAGDAFALDRTYSIATATWHGEMAQDQDTIGSALITQLWNGVPPLPDCNRVRFVHDH